MSSLTRQWLATLTMHCATITSTHKTSILLYIQPPCCHCADTCTCVCMCARVCVRVGTYLKQLVTAAQRAVLSHGTVAEHGADVVVWVHLHAVLHVHGALQADAQAASLLKLGQLRHLANQSTQKTSRGSYFGLYMQICM